MAKESRYREEYGEELVEACRNGYSPTGFAGKIGVSRPVLMNWVTRHPEFGEAYSRAKAARIRWFETQMQNILINGGTGGQATLLTFLLRNAGPEDYQDRKEITGADGKPLIEDSDPARVAGSLLELLKGEGMLAVATRAAKRAAAGPQPPPDPPDEPEEPDEPVPVEEPEPPPRPAAAFDKKWPWGGGGFQ